MAVARSLANLGRSLSHSEGAYDLPDGFRSKIINGDFDIWQRGISQTVNGYGSDDRWRNSHVGSTKTHTRQAFALGQTEVPGNPKFFSRTVVASVAGAGNYVSKNHNIEGVQTLSGRRATVTFYAKADTPRNVAVELFQAFGSGGSPSAAVMGIGSTLIELTASWKRYDVVVDIPSVAGKVLGTNGDDYLAVSIWLDAGSDYDSRSAGLGQQSGTFDIAHVSLVEGDATAEADPFSPRHIQQELALCQRYMQPFWMQAASYAHASGFEFQMRVPLLGMMRAVPDVQLVAAGTPINLASANLFAATQSATVILTATAAGVVGVYSRHYTLSAEL